jgi:endonuclease/exonuclease/phosphatase family metal-dependent hydrolase
MGIYDELFHMEFNECLANLFSRGNFKPLFLGDFNFHVDDPVNLHANKFLDTLTLFGPSQHVHVPTHSAGHTLDLVITWHNLNVYNIKTEASIVSDHDAVLFDLSSPRPVPPRTNVYYRKWRHANIPAFVNDL